ncbi:ABC transporter ATP-binding protein [Kytococcus sedentarius]|uniref:ABC transporter ATP-binding protein n=1 Tax=Kytococcus sedentarius TaxID=1276 RepID=UPI00384DDBB8
MTQQRDQASVLDLQEVTRTYRSGNQVLAALSAVSLACAPGTWTAVMGPSGSGKSTLLNCAAGLDRPDDGRVLLEGQDIAGLTEAKLARLRRDHMGFVFQQFNLVNALTAQQNVALPLRLAGRPDAEERATEALEELGLGEHSGHKPRELSGGQQQRVAIARAMAARPSILFADEPTGALDSRAAGRVLDLMRDLVNSRGQTVLMVTHDPAAAARADVAVFLRDGRLVDRLRRATSSQIATTLADLEGAR